MTDFEIAVVGGGLAGAIAALALARGGRKLALIAPPAHAEDRRTTALMDQSVSFLDRLGLWQGLRPQAAPLQTMRILDGTARLLRAPPTVFRAADIGLEAFGYNMPNAAIQAALDEALADEPNVTRFPSFAELVVFADDRVTLGLASGETITSGFAVGADGRRSKLRETAGIGIRDWTYPQSAMVLNFAHSLPHENISTEFHTEHGPFTQVPLPGQRSSLVWVQNPLDASARMELSLVELADVVEERMQSLLGRVTVEDGVQLWPLSGLMAKSFGKGRLALVGEAAHVFPPIGAQGLNLGLRDVMALTDLLCRDPALPIAENAGNVFDRKRRMDILTRTASVDLLNRSLLSDFLPVQMLRATGLHVLASVPPLRNLAMREGIEPSRGLRALPDLLFGRMRKKSDARS